MPAPLLLGVALHTLATAARDRQDDGRPMPRGAAAFAARLAERVIKPDALFSRIGEKLDASAKLLERLVAVRRAHPDVCPSEKLDRVAERLDRCRELLKALSEDMQTQVTPPQVPQDQPSQREGVLRLRTASEGNKLWQAVVDVYVTLLTIRDLLREKGHLNDPSDTPLHRAFL